MFNSNEAVLYTQPNCPFCVMLEETLQQAEIKYTKIDITQDQSAKNFMKAEGHRTVPQLYYKQHRLNTMDTNKISVDFLKNSITLYDDMDSIADLTDAFDSDGPDWPWQDSGIEQGI